MSGDNLYMLHADGHLSTRSLCRIPSVSTRLSGPKTPATLIRSRLTVTMTCLPAMNFTQLLFTALPDQSISCSMQMRHNTGRFPLYAAPSSYMNQFRPTTGNANPIPSGQPIGAITVGTNHVLYLAVDGQVYFANDMP
ncbi:MAG: hypothetical protein IPJ46_22770 [Anaerolineales bacterium]|nr:hypothetical protein [Anaerolineales bacterium]